MVEHRYKPIVGTSSITLLGTEHDTEDESADSYLSEQYRLYRRRYCIDQNLLRTLERTRRVAPKDSLPFAEQRIEYILGTGANWAGSIRDFRLVVDKGKPKNLVSFCGDGVKKIGPTRFDRVRKAGTTLLGDP